MILCLRELVVSSEFYWSPSCLIQRAAMVPAREILNHDSEMNYCLNKILFHEGMRSRTLKDNLTY